MGRPSSFIQCYCYKTFQGEKASFKIVALQEPVLDLNVLRDVVEKGECG